MDSRWTRRGTRGTAVVALLLLLGGCAQRSVRAGPGDAHAATWILVGVAAGAAALLVAALVLPRHGWRRLASVVLAVEAGVAVVGGALLVGAALRNRWLLDRAADEAQASTLVRLSDLDGRQASFFYALAALLAVVTVLVAIVLGLSSRFAASNDVTERWLATGVLALQCGVSAATWGVIAWGWRGPGVVATGLAFPLLVVAVLSCWPHEGTDHLASGTTGP